MTLESKFTELEHNSEADDTETFSSHMTKAPKFQDVHICKICGKDDFCSKKAVHGHMRIHGAKANKGVKRPEGTSVAQHSSTKIARIKYDIVHENNEEFVEDLYETEKDFFNYDTEELIAADSVFQLKSKLKVEQNTVNVIENKGTEVESFKESKASISCSNPKIYHCNECNKSFDTHQALGGHVASHNKHKKSMESGTRSGPIEPRDEQDVKGHKCSVCGKTFETGQILGGHKSKHFHERERLKASQGIGPIPTASITPSTVSGTNTNNVYVFDLNELPRIEDDVEDYDAI